MKKSQNPFKPGAGHYPPYLAGREDEISRCKGLFDQRTVLRNVIITGLRGVGKTVLLATVKPIATELGWMWCGTDMSESASVTEESLAMRLLADLAVSTSTIVVREPVPPLGFGKPTTRKWKLGFDELVQLHQATPGLASDRLKAALTAVWGVIKAGTKFRGVLFAYDEVQTLQDHPKKEEYPLSLLLDVFQSLQRSEIPLLLLLTGLPTLFPKLVAARTYSERMFESIFLERLSENESREAIERPIKGLRAPLGFTAATVKTIREMSGGYPYFIQFICKEVFDSFVQQMEGGNPKPTIPTDGILRKLDTDFFAGRWANLSDRERELLQVVASLESSGREFTVREVALRSKDSPGKPFGGSQITQMFGALSEKGIVYRHRHGRYSFAVPLFDQFIRRTLRAGGNLARGGEQPGGLGRRGLPGGASPASPAGGGPGPGRRSAR